MKDKQPATDPPDIDRTIRRNKIRYGTHNRLKSSRMAESDREYQARR